MAGQTVGNAQQTMTMEEVLKIVATMAAEMKKPYVDEAKVERDKRERAKMREDERQRIARREYIQKHCSHQDKHQRWAIALVHNHPDNQTRGFCNNCKSFIEPEHIEVGFDQVARLVPAHPQYGIVQRLELENSSVF